MHPGPRRARERNEHNLKDSRSVNISIAERNEPEHELGYVAEAAYDEIFSSSPAARTTPCEDTSSREVVKPDSELDAKDRFLRKEYPSLYLSLNREPITAVTSQTLLSDSECSLCSKLDKNTLDSLEIEKPCKIKGYLKSLNLHFSTAAVNTHLAHAIQEDNFLGVVRNMSADLLSKTYSVADAASRQLMYCVHTEVGRTCLAPDKEMHRIYGGVIKNFNAQVNTYLSLCKCAQSEQEKGNGPADPLTKVLTIQPLEIRGSEQI